MVHMSYEALQSFSSQFTILSEISWVKQGWGHARLKILLFCPYLEVSLRSQCPLYNTDKLVYVQGFGIVSRNDQHVHAISVLHWKICMSKWPKATAVTTNANCWLINHSTGAGAMTGYALKVAGTLISEDRAQELKDIIHKIGHGAKLCHP